MPKLVSTYEVVTDTVTVPSGGDGYDVSTYTLTAPTGKKPVAGGYRLNVVQGTGLVNVLGSYPDGDTWVFEISPQTNFAQTVDLFLVTATL